MKHIFLILSTFLYLLSTAEGQVIRGKIIDNNGHPMRGAIAKIKALNNEFSSDSLGNYELMNIPLGTHKLEAHYIGYQTIYKEVSVTKDSTTINISLKPLNNNNLNEVVISGTLKEVSKLDSPVPVEVYSAKFFKANPSPSVFEALQTINGVRPQLNCNVCNTGDIHINGLEGPYTMILIDGMPIVSGLSTVYGLSGIPQSLIDRIEIVKGPASTLYGSEAVGGLINIITKKTQDSPLISADIFGTSWGEINTDLGTKFNAGTRAQSIIGLNYFNYQNPIDDNNDNFTDVTLQNRISIFNKWNFDRKEKRIFSIAGRYIYEDRWGGEMNWSRKYRGGDQVYGESIYTSRWETFGTYQLPTKEKILFQFSANGHLQNSVYGNTPFIAKQYIGFAQVNWYKKIGNHDMLTGLTYRYTHYNDNTPATASKASVTNLPGFFIQDEISLNDNNKLLLGARYDYNSIHGSILTPRINYKWNSLNKLNIVRLSLGNGYRVANVFTEDHSALTGARQVVFQNELKPETSWNANINYVRKIYMGNAVLNLDASAFYTYFTNRIIADYDTNPNLIIYDNLEGHAISKGVSLNADLSLSSGLDLKLGATAMDVYSVQNRIKTRQMFAEKFSGTWNIGYKIKNSGVRIDYTGNLYGPMRLPLLSDTDPRKPYSPWWSIQNLQITKQLGTKLEIYGGVKNILNWTPNKGNPFIIARTNDPFDKNVQFDPSGQAMITPENPYGLTFDPTYVYGPNQRRRGFLGIRYILK